MVVRIRGCRMYLWRAVDDEGEVLDVLVQKRRNKHAALKLLRLLLKNQRIHPEDYHHRQAGVVSCGDPPAGPHQPPPTWRYA